MCRRYAGITGIALLAVLGFPGVSHASIWDWIWTMSGPQMIGDRVPLRVRLGTQESLTRRRTNAAFSTIESSVKLNPGSFGEPG